MSFANDAIGFYLQLDNTLSPELQVAAKDYERFTKSLDKWNTSAYKSASKGFGALTNLVESFEELPNKAMKSYTAALAQMRKAVKPITQPLILEVSPKGGKALGQIIGEAVSKVLSGVAIRLTATAPIKRSKLFDTSVALRQAYKGETQPPDMLGAFQGLPRFQKGGVVPGPGGIDEILALLTPGEAVLPADVVEELQSMAQGKEVSKSFSDALANITNIATAAEKLKDLAELGLDPTAQTKYNKAMVMLNDQLGEARENFKGMGSDVQRALLPAFKKATDQVKQFREEGDEAGGTFEHLLKDVLGQTRFLALHKALGSMQDAFGGARGAASELGEELGLDVDSSRELSSSMFEASKKLGLTRAGLYRTTEALIAQTRAFHGNTINADEVGRAYLAMTAAGETDMAMLDEMTPLAAMTAKAFGTDAGGVAASIYRLNAAFNFSRDEIAATFASFGRFAKQTPMNFEQFREKMMAQIEEGGLGAFLTEVKDPATQRSIIEQFGLITGALSQNWAEVGGEMGQLMSQALTDPREYGPRFLKLTGLSVDELRKGLAAGRGVEIIEAMSAKLSQFSRDTTQNLKPVLEALGFEGTPEQFKRIAEEGGAIVDTARRLRASIVPAHGAMGDLAERAESTRGAWQGFKDSIGLWFSEKFGIRLSEFFDDFNPQVIASAKHLAELAGMSVKAGVAIVKFLAKVPSAVMGVVGLLPKAAKGVTEVVAGAGKAAKTGGYLTGLAGGLMVLAPALSAFGKAMIGYGGIGLIALTGAIIGLGYALKLAAPFILALGQAIGAAISPIFGALKEMGAGQILASAGALLVLGPSLGAIGAGAFAMSLGLVASVPGMLLFAGALKLYSALGGGEGFGGVIEGLIAAFQVDQTKLDAAVRAMRGIMLFTGGLMAVGATMTALSVASVVKRVGGLVSGVLGIFGIASPMERLVDQAASLAGTVAALTTSFNFSPSQLRKMEGVQKTLEIVAEFTGGYSRIATHLKGITPGLFGGLRGGVLGIIGYLGVGSPMRALRVDGKRIVTTLGGLAEAFSGPEIAAVLPKLSGVQKTLEVVAEFTGDYSKIAKSLQDVTPGVLSGSRWGVIGALAYVFGGSGMGALAGQAETISTTLNTLVTDFKLLVSKEAVDGVVAALQMVTPLVAAFKPLADTIAASGKSVNAVSTWFFDTPLDNIAGAMPNFRKGFKTIVEQMNGLREDIGVGTTAASLTGTLDVLTTVTEGLLAPADAIGALSKVMSKVKAGTAVIVQSMPSFRDGIRSIITGLVDLKEVTSAVTKESINETLDLTALALKGVTSQATMLNSVVGGLEEIRDSVSLIDSETLQGAKTAIANLRQEFSRPIVARSELEKTVAVELDPNTTDKPVHEAVMRSNELLAELLGVMRGGGVTRVASARAGARAGPRARGIDADVAGIATGERF